MGRYLYPALLLLLGMPAITSAAPHVHVGVGVYYGPHAYYRPYYRPYYGYYGPAYYYGPGYYYAPPATVYAEPETTVVQAPANYWYYCASSKAYYPYVTNCPSGWEAVPAQAPPSNAAQPAAPAKTSSAAPQPKGPSGSVMYRFGDLLFASGQAVLQPAAQNSLSAMLTAAKKDPLQHITISGYTDASGDAESNRGLSQLRAEAVKQFLVQHGIPADNITAIGKGSDEPIGDNNTAEGRKLNRRVEVVVG